jgi:predicted phage terminase large subunit-like protein
MSRFPLTTNMIISVSAKQAELRLEMVRDIVKNNARFKNVFPWIGVDERQRNTIQEFSVVANGIYDESLNKAKPIQYNVWRSMVARHGSLKDPTLYVSGSGGKGVIGRRISGLMVLDDIIDESHLRAELQDDVYDYLMRTLIPCVMDNAKVVAIGTRWMPEDLPERLKKNPGWCTIEIPAIKYNEKGEAQSYWPEYWPLEKLERRRVEMDNDALFRVAYLNDPSAFASAKFLPGGLVNPLPPNLPEFTQVLIGTDFAISTKKDADFTVFVAVGVDASKNLFVLDWRRIKTTPDIMVMELGKFAINTANTYGRLDMVLIEKVAFQTVMQFSMADKYPGVPVHPLPPIGDKGHRTEQLAIKCNENKVFFDLNNVVHKEFKAEAMNFKIHRHDDCLDALSQIVQFMGSSIQNVRVRRVKSPFML